MEIIINSVLAEMQPILKASQLKRLKDALDRAFEPKQNETNEMLLRTFLTAKEVEGCSSKTLQYYDDTLVRALATIGKPIGAIESDDKLGSIPASFSVYRFSILRHEGTKEYLFLFFTYSTGKNQS